MILVMLLYPQKQLHQVPPKIPCRSKLRPSQRSKLMIHAVDQLSASDNPPRITYTHSIIEQA